MTTLQRPTKVYTQSKDWQFHTHGYGAIAIAAVTIAAGFATGNHESVGFECYARENKDDSTEMTLKAIHYFGIKDIEGRSALRVHNEPNLEGAGSHSVIASWYPPEIVTDSTYIAAAISQYLCRAYSDYFVIESAY